MKSCTAVKIISYKGRDFASFGGRARRYFLALLAIAICCAFSACNAGFQKMQSSEYSVVFSKLPRFLGGGMRDKTLNPGEMEFVFPWEELYRFDTSVQSLSWGAAGTGNDHLVEDYVETRALDGNEVGLAITVHYHVNPARLHHVVQYVGVDNNAIKRLVAAIARADIRTHMNILRTRDFFNPEKFQSVVDRVKIALNTRLEREGIVIDSVIYNDHRFERRLPDGTYDRSYQEQIDRTQAINQETEQEYKKVATVVEGKRQVLNETQAVVNRKIAEVEGFKRQAILRGDAYLKAKTNEAERVRSVGLAEVEGLKKEIAALSGPGGEALLRLSVVKELLKTNPHFVLVDSTSGESSKDVGLNFNRIDTNDLLLQSGFFDGLKKEVKGEEAKAKKE